ncbi:MAG: hypothetical protein ACI4PP_05380, partial [Clostridia bacterium]
EDQIMLLENYKTSIDKHVQKVIDALEGSPDGRDVTMKNNFETTKENINKAVTQLNIAKAQLESIRLM